MIKHAFQSTKPDGNDGAVVRPSNWNEAHNAPPFVCPLVNASTTWTNMPAAATEFIGNPRTMYDLTHADEVRIVVCVGVATANGATLTIQYSTDETNWSDLTPASPNLNSTGCKNGEWGVVPAGAKSDVFLRILGQGGNGAADPQFRLVQLQVK